MSWFIKVSELYLTRSRLLDLTDWLSVKTLVTISNDDGNGNENGKKTIGWQNNNLARASRFFVYFFAVATQLQRESA